MIVMFYTCICSLIVAVEFFETAVRHFVSSVIPDKLCGLVRFAYAVVVLILIFTLISKIGLFTECHLDVFSPSGVLAGFGIGCVVSLVLSVAFLALTDYIFKKYTNLA